MGLTDSAAASTGGITFGSLFTNLVTSTLFSSIIVSLLAGNTTFDYFLFILDLLKDRLPLFAYEMNEPLGELLRETKELFFEPFLEFLLPDTYDAFFRLPFT